MDFPQSSLEVATPLKETPMRKIFFYTAVPILLVLSSCATPGWYKAGVSRMDTENALAQCEYNVSINKVNDDRFDKTVNNCMKAQGFRYVDNVPKESSNSSYSPQPASPAPQASQQTSTAAPSDSPADPASNAENTKDEWWK